MNLFLAVITQSLTFLPLALGISISYHILRATDMTIDGSFVLGAGVFAKFVTMGYSPALAAFVALLSGACAGAFTAFVQRGGRIDPLLAGVLSAFVLSSMSLILMGKPNISLLMQRTLLSAAFANSDVAGWITTGMYVLFFCFIAVLLLSTRFGLELRAFGDNPSLLTRLGKQTEIHRLAGFALTNTLAAAAGCLTAQTIGYADIGMGAGMTLTGIGAIILGQQLLQRFYRTHLLRIGMECFACLLGVIAYYFLLNALLRADINPIYLKMLLGLLIIMFLRTALNRPATGVAS